jgi:hypothetical protein
MYGKFFSSAFTGSMLGSGSDVFAVWGYVIANAAADGLVEINPKLLAMQIGMPVEDVEKVLDLLCAPDQHSRSKKMEGRRMVKVDEFLYEIPNYLHYRGVRNNDERRSANREAQRKSRAKQKLQDVSTSSRMSSMSAQEEGEEEGKEEEQDTHLKVSVAKGDHVPYKKIVDLYHAHCPQLPVVKVLNDKRKAQLRSRWKTFAVMRGKGEDAKSIKFDNLNAWERYFKFITKQCPFLNGQNDRGWLANFDFCIRESAMVKVMENQYVGIRK